MQRLAESLLALHFAAFSVDKMRAADPLRVTNARQRKRHVVLAWAAKDNETQQQRWRIRARLVTFAVPPRGCFLSAVLAALGIILGP